MVRKIAKLALLEMTSSKDTSLDWQKAASALLVAIGSRLPDLMMDEAFLQLGGNAISVSAVVQTLSEFALAAASQFAPRVKGVLSRVLPRLGGVKDTQRQVYASAFKSWCWAISQYYEDFPSALPLDSDTIAFLHSAFELFLRSWVGSRELKVRVAVIEALGQMVPLISRMLLKTALPRFLPSILSMYRREKENPLPVTQSLHILLETALKPFAGVLLLDFQGVIVVVNTLLPMSNVQSKCRNSCDAGLVLKNLNEVLRCLLTIGTAFPDDFFTFLINRITSKEEAIRLGTMSVFKHLLPRLSGVWAERKSQLVDAVKVALHEQDLITCKALSELIIAMASTGWVEGSSGEVFVEFLVQQCAINDKEMDHYKVEEAAIKKAIGLQSSEAIKTELNLGVISPSDLHWMCDTALILLASTLPDIEPVLWPFLLRLLVPARYTWAVATVSKCISDISRQMLTNGRVIDVDYTSRPDIPKPEELLARLLVMLQNPVGKEKLADRILTVLFYLRTLYPKAVGLLWEDEIPKLKAYISDLDDLKADSWQQSTWDDMIIHLLAESLDVIRSTEWTISLGNAFAGQYDLYVGDQEHSALLHRCLGMLLQKVDDRSYIQEKISVMYKRADICDVTNRLGLAMGMGLVAAAHLDTVLEKLKKILESQNRNRFQRFLSIFTDQGNKPDVDDVYAALALMYGYAATYAPSTVIEARIHALVGTNMLAGLLDVRTAAAKQSVITAIDLLGQAVIRAGANGRCFILNKRDELLDYILKLMAGENSSIDDPELLETQILALNACITLVSVEPKLTVMTRNLVLEATLTFITLPTEPVSTINSLISKLTVLLRAIVVTSGEDGRSRADQLQHLLKSLDPYVSSSTIWQRSRACTAVLELLQEFQSHCSSGSCSFRCPGSCAHFRPMASRIQSSSGGALLLPSRESLNLGERLMVYIPRCADISSGIRKLSAQILDVFFSIALILPDPVGSTNPEYKQSSYAALSALEELIAVTNWDSVSENDDAVLFHIVEYVSNLLLAEELVAALRGCVGAICDKVRSSSLGAIRAVAQLLSKTGQELSDLDITRITQSLVSASGIVGDRIMRQEVLSALCCLAQHTHAHLVFSELLAAAEKDIMNKDVSRFRGGWPIQEAFIVIAQHELLASAFLDYVISVLNQAPLFKDSSESSDQLDLSLRILNQLPQAGLIALAAFFRKSVVGRRAIEHRYAGVLCALLLQFGSYHGISTFDMQPLRNSVKTFEDFCDCIGDKDMGKILAQDGEQLLAGEKWTAVVGQIANCVSAVRPKEVENICSLLLPVLKRTSSFQREVAVAVLSEYVHCCHRDSTLLNLLVVSLSSHIGDESPVVRRLCVKGLVEIPKEEMPNYSSQLLSVIIASIEDAEVVVALTAVQGLTMVLEAATEGTVSPFLLNLCVRLRSLQIHQNMSIRAAAFGALGHLTRFEEGSQHELFLEQVHACLPRLVFHMYDEALPVRQSCKATLKNILSLLDVEATCSLNAARTFISDRRLDYDEFLKDFTRHLSQRFLDRMGNYIASAIQGFDSPWPMIQANAAYFAACLLSQLVDQRLLTLYLPQIVSSLVRMASSSLSSTVRATSARSLSVLLNSIH
eukprot:c28637_g1_i1 orf=1-4821(+)